MTTTLFKDKIKISKNTELQKLFEKYFIYDPYYIVSSGLKERREHIDKIWEIYQPHANNHFLKEYKLRDNFHSRTWEMYIGAILIANGIAFNKNPKDDWPDFSIEETLYIECVACRNANSVDKPDYVPLQKYDGKVHDVPRDQMLLRIASAFRDKYRLYKSKHVESTIPFVIAINSGIFNHAQGTVLPLIYDLLFGIDCFVAKYTREGMTLSNIEVDLKTREKLYKGETKSPVDVNLFQTKKFSEVSAVIFSSNLIINSPKDMKDWGSDCLIIPNPNAKNPINLDEYNFFKRPEDVKGEIKVI